MTATTYHQRSATALESATVLGLIAAGLLHLLLAPGHLASETMLAAGFVVAGVTQLVLAGLLLVVRTRRLLVAVATVSLLFVGVWVLDSVLGLSLVGHAATDGPAGGLDGFALLTKGAELVSAGAALWRLRGVERPALYD